MVYDDGRVACTDDELVIRWYYFPFGTKRVRYADVRAVRRCQPARGRIWGSSDLRHFYNLDPRRPHKDIGLEIDTGRFFTPVITPDDPKAIVDELTRHGVRVT